MSLDKLLKEVELRIIDYDKWYRETNNQYFEGFRDAMLIMYHIILRIYGNKVKEALNIVESLPRYNDIDSSMSTLRTYK